MVDEVYIVDPGGYVGESTRREIAYAESLGKPVRYLSRERMARTGDDLRRELDQGPARVQPEPRLTGRSGGVTSRVPVVSVRNCWPWGSDQRNVVSSRRV